MKKSRELMWGQQFQLDRPGAKTWTALRCSTITADHMAHYGLALADDGLTANTIDMDEYVRVKVMKEVWG